MRKTLNDTFPQNDTVPLRKGEKCVCMCLQVYRLAMCVILRSVSMRKKSVF